MRIARRFLIAPSLARLVRREVGARRVLEGHFPPSHNRQSHVLLDGKCHLVLLTREPGGEPEEERAEVSLRQAHFLLDICAGKIIYERSRIDLSEWEAAIDSFTAPGALVLAALEFEIQEEADGFAPPAWFGPEVTKEAGYERQSIAIKGLPHVPDVPLTEAGLNGLLDRFDQLGKVRSSGKVEPFGRLSSAIANSGQQMSTPPGEQPQSPRAAE
jgi:CYTH domain-containing protein